jgi:hypothetical protein
MGDPETTDGAKEIPLEEDDANDFNSVVIGKLRAYLEDDYAPPGFFDEGEVPADIPPFTVPKIDSDYTLTRVGRGYLHLLMTRLPAGETSSSLGKTVELVYGEKPLTRHKVGNNPPKDNTTQVAKNVTQFMADLGSELALQGHPGVS